jgi:Mg2+ and Co2+ transporter CorA
MEAVLKRQDGQLSNPNSSLSPKSPDADGQMLLFEAEPELALQMPRMVEECKVKRILSATLVEEPTEGGARTFSIDFRVHDPRGAEIGKLSIGPADESRVRDLYGVLGILMNAAEAPKSESPTLAVTVDPAEFGAMLGVIERSGLPMQGTFGEGQAEMANSYRHALATFAARDIVRTLRVNRETNSADIVDGIEHLSEKDRAQLLWIDVRRREPLVAEYLADRYGLDRRAIEQGETKGLSTEFFGFGDQVFLRTFLHSVDPRDPTKTDKQELRIFAGRDFLITWHEGENEAVRALQDHVLERAKRNVDDAPINSVQLFAELVGVIGYANLVQLERLRSALENDQRSLVVSDLKPELVQRASEARAFAQELQAEADSVDAHIERLMRVSPLLREEGSRCNLENARGAMQRVSQKAGQVIERAKSIHEDFRAMTAHATQAASYSLSQAGALVASVVAGITVLNYAAPGVGEFLKQLTSDNPWFSFATVSLLAAGLGKVWQTIGRPPKAHG